MYRRPKFLELLLEIRREMALEADYDVDLFVEIARHGDSPHREGKGKDLNGAEAADAPGAINDDRSGLIERRGEVRKA
jgi:hypothetical protein